jgi:hypothetical protein
VAINQALFGFLRRGDRVVTTKYGAQCRGAAAAGFAGARGRGRRSGS